jgi:type I restriction enzyme S subunit
VSAAKGAARTAGEGRYKPYPAYKDSGVEWLGEIPAHWEVAPVYARYEVALGKMLDAKRVTGEFSGPYLRNVDVQWDMVNTEGLPEMDFAPWERERYSVRSGDLLVCEGGEVGRTAIWRGQIAPCFYQKALHRVRPRAIRDDPRFFFYLMYMVAKRGVFAGAGNQNTIDHLTAVQLKHYRFPFAREPEQRAIAAFLDRETARIDALVAKKERLIALLREQRTALITRAVTKGLDPTVPMKDSGVEWLGEIPVGWKQRAVWTLFSLGRGRVISHEEIHENQGPYPVFSSQTENDGIMGHLATYDFDGDFLTWTTDGAKAGTVFVRSGRFNCTNVCGTLKVRGSDQLDLRFVRDALNGATAWFVRHDINPKLMNNVMARIRIQIPSPAEQRAIAAFLDHETARIDGLVAKVREAIERLKELRTALISAAVTGKIDVREEGEETA